MKHTPFVTAAFVMAALFSLLCMLPSFLQRADSGYPYQGIHMLGPDAEVYYAARVREIYDGFPGLGNVFFSAPKDLPFIQPPLPELAIARTGQFFGVDALTAFLGSKVVLSFAVFLLFTGFLLLVTGSPWISLLSVSAILFAGALLSAPWDVPHFFRPWLYDFEFLRFSRAVNPQWSVSWFLVAIIGLAAWIRFDTRRFLLLTFASTGILIYSYVYAWTYLLAAVGLLTLWYSARRDWSKAIPLSGYWFGVVVVATPYVLHMISLSGHEWYAESAKRLGLVAQHGPLFLGVWLAVFIAVSLASRRLWPRTWPLLPALAFAGLIAINHHVITGQYIVPHHYHWYFIQPLGSLTAVAFAFTIVSSLFSVRMNAFLGSLLVAAFLAVAGVQQVTSFFAIRQIWGALQDAAPAMRHIADTMRPGDVVYTQAIDIANIVPVFTSADVYFAGNAGNSLASTERVLYTYFFDLWLQGARPKDIREEFPTVRRGVLGSRMRSMYYREAAGDFAAIPDEEVNEAILAYEDFFRLSLREKLKEYPIHAVITTPKDPENPAWEQFLACSRETFSGSGYGVRLMISEGEQGSCL